MSTENITVGELSLELQDKIKTDISHYSLGLVAVHEKEFVEEGQIIGSGTFIKAGSKHAILTAYHVVNSKSFKNSSKIGIAMLSMEHRFFIETKYIYVEVIGEPQKGENKPDLALIILPEFKVSTICQYKSFWNLDKYSKFIVESPSDLSMGVWSLFGGPDELSTVFESSQGHEECIGFFGLSGLSGVDNYQRDDQFDYYEMPISHGSESNSPKSFGGVSGGGLWRTELVRTKSGEIENNRAELYGVPYYQSEVVNNERKIFCHGHRSIYGCAYEKLIGLQ